jgi:hypothetical protein
MSAGFGFCILRPPLRRRPHFAYPGRASATPWAERATLALRAWSVAQLRWAVTFSAIVLASGTVRLT